MYEFDKELHLHKLDGKPLTGVTTVLKVVSKGDALMQWAVNEAVKHLVMKGKPYYGPNDDLEDHYIVNGKVLDEAKKAHTARKTSAGNVGTKVHEWIESFVKGENPKRDDEIHHITENFVRWWKDHNVRLLETERNVWSKELWIGGIVDLVLEIDGKVWVGDIKTSGAIYPEYFWQTSAYQYCLQEQGMYPEIEGHIILRCGKDGSFEVEKYRGYEENIDAFKSCLKIYRQLEKLKGLKKQKKWKN